MKLNRQTKENMIDILKNKNVVGIILGICTIVGAFGGIPYFVQSCSIPEVTFKIGDYTIDANKTIVLHYLVDSKMRAQKCILPLPMSFSNKTNQDVHGFNLQFMSDTRPIVMDNGEDNIMIRLLIEENHSQGLSRYDSKPGPKSKYQIIGITQNHQTIRSSETYSDLIRLNSVTNDINVLDRPYDAFTFEMNMKSNDVEKEYHFEVYFYFSENFQLTKRKLQLEKREDVRNFVIETTYSDVSSNGRGKMFNVFSVKEGRDSVVEI